MIQINQVSGITFVAGFALLIITILVFHVQIEHDKYEQVGNILHNFTQHNAIINQDLLLAHHGFLENYDSVWGNINTLKKLLNKLQTGEANIYQQGYRKIDHAIETLHSDLTTKEKIIVTFKASAVIKNSKEEQLLLAAIDIPIIQHSTELIHAFNVYMEHRIIQVNRIRLFLYSCILTLLAYLTIVLVNLKNEVLERQKIDKKEIAERKIAEEKSRRQHEFLQSVIDSLDHPFYVINVNNYQIELINSFMYSLGFQSQTTCYKLTHHRNEPCIGVNDPCPLEKIKQTKKPIILEHIHFDKDGNSKNVEVHGFPIFDSDGNITKMIEYSLDITERKRSEEKLKRLTKNLKETGKRLTIALEEAENANQSKSRFLANMSHELRTPMNAIMGFTQLALSTNLNHKQSNYIKQVYTSSKDLLGIINDILDISKIETGMLEVESRVFLLDEILSNIPNLFDMKIDEKNLQLRVITSETVPQYLIGDPLRLKQILINLTSNAIKFTEQGEIVIKIETIKLEMEQATLHFSVQDSGIGIAKEVKPYLFDAFTQADSGFTRRFGGIGLGLAICKSLVNIMGGEIWVDSQLGKGSKFSFSVSLGYRVDNDITVESEYLLPAIKDNVGNDELKHEISLNTSAVTALLVELFKLLKKGNINSEKVFKSLKAELEDSLFTYELIKIENCLNRFDFKGAQAPLNEIANVLKITL